MSGLSIRPRPRCEIHRFAQNLLLAVATDDGGISKSMGVFREGVAKWSNYDGFYGAVEPSRAEVG